MRPLHVLLAAGLIVPSIARASFPSPANSTTPSCFSLVGTSGGIAASAAGQFTVVVRDLANNPIVGAAVVIDLSGCPDLHICADQLDPTAIVDCVHKQVTKIADNSGSATFTVLGGSNGAGNAMTFLNAGKIFENGTLIGSPTVSAFDLDGASGVGANDLAAWLTDFGAGQLFGRSDYDCNGCEGANDLALWLTVFGSGTMASSCANSCP